MKCLRTAVTLFLILAAIAGCGSAKQKQQEQQTKAQGAAEQQVKNPELKNLLDHRKQQRQVEYDLQNQVMQDEIKQKTYSKPQKKSIHSVQDSDSNKSDEQDGEKSKKGSP